MAAALEEGERLLASDMPQRDRLQFLSTLSCGSMFAGDLQLGLQRLDELDALCREEAWEQEGCGHRSRGDPVELCVAPRRPRFPTLSH